MDIKQYNNLTRITLTGPDVKLKPENIGHLEISKNGNGKKIFKTIVIGDISSGAKSALGGILRFIQQNQEDI